MRHGRKSTEKKKAEEIREPADVQYQLAKFMREHGKATVGTRRNVVLAPDDSSPCPPTRVSSRRPKKCTCRIKLVWTSCKGLGALSAVRGDSFPHRSAAKFAAAEYKACHGWTPFIGLCELCSAFHLYHSPTPKKMRYKRVARRLSSPTSSAEQAGHLSHLLLPLVHSQQSLVKGLPPVSISA
jgi:hypothetical protein